MIYFSQLPLDFPAGPPSLTEPIENKLAARETKLSSSPWGVVQSPTACRLCTPPPCQGLRGCGEGSHADPHALSGVNRLSTQRTSLPPLPPSRPSPAPHPRHGGATRSAAVLGHLGGHRPVGGCLGLSTGPPIALAASQGRWASVSAHVCLHLCLHMCVCTCVYTHVLACVPCMLHVLPCGLLYAVCAHEMGTML